MLSFFPRGVLDEIRDLTESVSECFPTYCVLISKSRGMLHIPKQRVQEIFFLHTR